MIYGYARVSTKDQNLDRQVEALKKAGCEDIFEEKESCRKERPEREKIFNLLKEGDTFIFLDLDRTFRNMIEAILTLVDFEKRGIMYKCLGFSYLDTTNENESEPAKLIRKIVIAVMGGFAEYELSMNYERTMTGIRVAEMNGVVFGRKRLRESDPTFEIRLKEMCNSVDIGAMTVADACAIYSIPKTTYYRYLQEAEIKDNFNDVINGEKNEKELCEDLNIPYKEFQAYKKRIEKTKRRELINTGQCS